MLQAKFTHTNLREEEIKTYAEARQEQINDPANPHNRWNYRMHLTLDQLLAQSEFNSYLRKKIEASGR